MKFKEALDFTKVVSGDKKEKLFDEETQSVLVELEKTTQDFWNVDEPTANFLNLLIKIKGVKSALEIGTSNGYSAIWLAKALIETGGKLTTIEFWEKRSVLAIENFKKSGVFDVINVITGDAIDILGEMKKLNKEKFDFIFVDANKAEYIDYFNLYEPLLDKGGLIVADNIVSHYKKTKPFIDEIMKNPNYQTQILNFDAGILLSRKVN